MPLYFQVVSGATGQLGSLLLFYCYWKCLVCTTSNCWSVESHTIVKN